MDKHPSLPLGSVSYPWGLFATCSKQAEHNVTLCLDILGKFMLLHQAFISSVSPPAPRP